MHPGPIACENLGWEFYVEREAYKWRDLSQGLADSGKGRGQALWGSPVAAAQLGRAVRKHRRRRVPRLAMGDLVTQARRASVQPQSQAMHARDRALSPNTLEGGMKMSVPAFLRQTGRGRLFHKSITPVLQETPTHSAHKCSPQPCLWHRGLKEHHLPRDTGDNPV